MADAEFTPVEPFDVDDGELDGLTPAECFVLGVEWQMVAARAATPDGFERPVHVENRDRLAALLDRRGRRYRMAHMHDDVSEGWLWLTVLPDGGDYHAAPRDKE